MSARAAAFLPELACDDAEAGAWIREAALRLRREVSWRWHLSDRGAAPAPTAQTPDARLIASLDLTRHATARQEFFAQDATAQHLTAQLGDVSAAAAATPTPGGFGWLRRTLVLDDAESFALALGLAVAFDAAVGPVIAACHGDAARTLATLGLAQLLWDRPADLVPLLDPDHRLWRLGLLVPSAPLPTRTSGWDAELAVPALVARQLLFPEGPLPRALVELDRDSPPSRDDADVETVVARLRASPADRLCVVPLRGPTGGAATEVVAAIADGLGWRAARCAADFGDLQAAPVARSLMTVAWLRRTLLLLDGEGRPAGDGRGRYAALGAAEQIPAVACLTVDDPTDLAGLSRRVLVPGVALPPLDYAGRRARWQRALRTSDEAGPATAALDGAVAECARRFRFEDHAVRAVAGALRALDRPVTPDDLFAACRAESPVDAGDLAQRVRPRFGDDDLVLPPTERVQFEEIFRAMRALTEVHYEWGAARASNESGIAVMFSGGPGTGKSMAAEVLAARLDLPLYRIDLSQVVNKYIGETEKNLKRLFDVADQVDTILFFDECDALFGRRTEVRDAHDRYANLEISYLLDRMDRFKGLAVLATNRRKDCDEALVRRLRYIVEFPQPDAAQRRALWRRAFPPRADVRALDFEFLARQFQLAGGHIRSIALNACLQTAGQPARAAGERPGVTMATVLTAVQREYDKLGRTVAVQQFGRYAQEMERAADA